MNIYINGKLIPNKLVVERGERHTHNTHRVSEREGEGERENETDKN